MKLKILFFLFLVVNLLTVSIIRSQNKNSILNTVSDTTEISNIKNSNNTIYQDNSSKNNLTENLIHEKQIILKVGILILSVFILLFFIAGMQFKKVTNKLKDKNHEIEAQREEIEKQKEHITQKTIDLLVLNKELKENNELREGLTGMIVHDLKNPISNIINLSENREITFFAKNMLIMVENILDIQKYEGMIMPLNLKSIPLKNLVNEAVVQISLYAEHKNIKIENKVSDKIVVSVDEGIIKRVFVNLLSNAVKYTFNNGLINIESEINSKNPDKVKVSVVDNGIGIKEDRIPLIFNKFSQIIARNTGEARSTGIGLTFCKMAVEAHAGKIIVKSVPNEFTSFEFLLSVPKSEMIPLVDNNPDNNTRNSYLNEKDRNYLRTIYSDLKKLEVYEISKLRVILNLIDSQFSENVKIWKDDLNNAIYNCNFELYNELREKINL